MKKVYNLFRSHVKHVFTGYTHVFKKKLTVNNAAGSSMTIPENTFCQLKLSEKTDNFNIIFNRNDKQNFENLFCDNRELLNDLFRPITTGDIAGKKYNI